MGDPTPKHVIHEASHSAKCTVPIAQLVRAWCL